MRLSFKYSYLRCDSKEASSVRSPRIWKQFAVEWHHHSVLAKWSSGKDWRLTCASCFFIDSYTDHSFILKREDLRHTWAVEDVWNPLVHQSSLSAGISLFSGVVDFPTYHEGELGQPSSAHSLCPFSTHLHFRPPVQKQIGCKCDNIKEQKTRELVASYLGREVHCYRSSLFKKLNLKNKVYESCSTTW